MTNETVGGNSGCEGSSHEQHLCYMVSQGFHLTDADEYKALVRDPQFRCQKCGRAAKSGANLCDPVKLSRYQAIASEGFAGRMMKFGSVDELLDAAIIREIKAQELYAKMASMVENPWMKKVLDGFAREERLHQAKLEAVKAGEITLQEVQTSDLDVGIADNIEDSKPDANMDYPELLAYAIGKENASVKLYTAMSSIISEPELKDMFLKLAREEANHKRRLEIEYDLMTS